ncbi:MAG TPA: hypothetical protein VF779_02955 [Pyrinomonadaceae bacterium]
MIFRKYISWQKLARLQRQEMAILMPMPLAFSLTSGELRGFAPNVELGDHQLSNSDEGREAFVRIKAKQAALVFGFESRRLQLSQES